jgi:hypothetical protein
VLRARHAGLPSDVDARLEELLLATSNGAGDSELRRLLLALVPDFTGYAPRHTIDETPLLPITAGRNGSARPGTRRPRADVDDAAVRDTSGHGDGGGERRVSSM